ncbi:MAG: hypothetical protein M5R38_09520 [Candidatus Methylomirabilis sp.]|nr:hypothetical protein [Candidatus Methylomirabilis sp.]
MCGNYENSERLLARLLDHAQADLDKAECLAEQTTSLSSVGNFIKAIETANRGLAYFGKAIPDHAEEADRRRRALMTEIASQGIDIWNTILNMPFTTDRKRKIELAFYSELIPDLYMSGLVPQLYLSAAQSTQHCLSGGWTNRPSIRSALWGCSLANRRSSSRPSNMKTWPATSRHNTPTPSAPRGDERDRLVQYALAKPPATDRGLLPQVDPVREKLWRSV